MSLYKTFETNKEIEQTGIDLRYSDTCVITVARAGGSNKKFLKAAERAQRKLNTRRPNNEQAMQILREVYADAVILGWEGVEDRDGIPMPFSRENVIKILTDLPDLFADIRQQAENAELFRDEALEDAAKN